MTADRDGSETGRLELEGAVGHVVRMRRRSVPIAGNHRVVVRLHVDPERVAARGEDVLGVDDGERPVRSKQPLGFRVPHVGIDPVEGSEGGDRVELRARRLPGLERCVHDLHAGKAASLRPAIAARPSPSSTQTISRPRAASDSVA